MYSQVLKLARIGSSVADNLKRAHDLYRQKDAKGGDFVYEHCWLLVRDNPRWALGWAQEKPPTLTRSAMSRSCQSQLTVVCPGRLRLQVWEAVMIRRWQTTLEIFKERVGRTKAAKDEVSRSKMREGGLYAQATAADKMAESQMLKAVGLVDQNLLLLMTTDDSALVNAKARECAASESPKTPQIEVADGRQGGC